jgi:DNA mismatch repair protein MutS2
MPQPPFKSGDYVRTAHNKTPGEIIDGPNKKEEYLISVGSLNFWVHQSKLQPAVPPKKRKKAQPAGHKGNRTDADILTVDLHAMTREQALIRLEEALDRALIDAVARIQVIHGIGTGAVRKAVHEYLAASRHITRFELDNANAGTTWVYL